MDEKPRCLIVFEQSIRSEATLRIYNAYLSRFLKWVGVDYQSLLLLPREKLQQLVEDYLIYLKRRLNPNSIGPHLSAIQRFLDINDKEYNRRKLRMLLPEKVKPAGGKAWSTEQISQMLKFADTKRAKAVIHFLTATGCRVGAIKGLKIKNLKDMPDGCKAVTFYSGSKWEYASFLHKEAVNALNDYHNERSQHGEKLDQDSFVFRERYVIATQQAKSLSGKGAQAMITKILKRAGINRKREENSTRFEIPIDTGFRKRFNTILKSNPEIPYAIAERLMDHRTNLELYYLDTPVNSLFSEYQKAIPQLIIDETERLKSKNRQLIEENSELEKKNERIDELEKRFRRLEKTREF